MTDIEKEIQEEVRETPWRLAKEKGLLGLKILKLVEIIFEIPWKIIGPLVLVLGPFFTFLLCLYAIKEKNPLWFAGTGFSCYMLYWAFRDLIKRSLKEYIKEEKDD